MSNSLATNPQLVEKAQQIADTVARSLEMAIFKQAERDLQGDETVQSLLAEVQAKQAAGEDVDAVLERLEALDIVRHFTIAQQNLSEVVEQVTKILGAYASDRVDVLEEKEESTGGCASCPGADLCSGGQSGKSENCSGDGHEHGHDHAFDSKTSCAG